MYCETKEIWNWLNKSTRIREEVLTTSGDGSTLTFSLSNSNVISGSTAVKYGSSGGYLTASILTSSEYSSELDDGNITLTTTGATTVSGSYVWADYEHAPIKDSVIADLVSSSDNEIERRIGRNFNSNSGEIDYISVKDDETVFFTRYYPILTLSAVDENDQDVTDTPNWVTRTEGIGNDFINNSYDKEIGRLRFIDNQPSSGTDNLRITYDWGYASIPYEAKMTSILMTVKGILDNPVFKKSIVSGEDKFVNLRTDMINDEIEKRLLSLKRMQFRLVEQE